MNAEFEERTKKAEGGPNVEQKDTKGRKKEFSVTGMLGRGINAYKGKT